MTKRCVGCGNYGGRNKCGFYKSSATDDGWNRYCKHCCKVNRALESVRARDKKSKLSRRQIHRAQGLGVVCETDLRLARVFRRDAGICGICNEWVAPKHASMDHKLPLALGGTHTFDNVQLSHLLCNLRKGDRI